MMGDVEEYEVCGVYCAQLPGHDGRCDDGVDLHDED